jgi:dephospho-CoA kinase
MGLPVFRFGSVVINELTASGREITPESEAMIRMELRAAHGDDFLAARALRWIDEHRDETLVILEGVYTPAEYELLRHRLQSSFVTIAIITDRDLRYQRLASRADRPIAAEAAEARDLDEIRRLQKAEPLARADYFVLNNGPSSAMLERVVSLCDAFHRNEDSSIDASRDAFLDADPVDLLATLPLEQRLDVWSLSLLVHRAVVSEDPHLIWHVCRAIRDSSLYRGLEFLKWVAARDDLDLGTSSTHRIAAQAIARMPVEQSGYLMNVLTHGTGDQRIFAADALGELRATNAMSLLRDSVRSGEWNVALWSALSLSKLGEQACGMLVSLVTELRDERRYLAFDALARVSRPAAQTTLQQMQPELATVEFAALSSLLR